MAELIEGWAVVRVVAYEHQADMIRDFLEQAGFEATVFSQKDHMNVVWVGDLSEIKVLVPKEREAEALEVLKDLQLPERELSEDADTDGDSTETPT